MSIRWPSVAVLAVILVTTSCASSAVTGDGGASASPSAVAVPFDTFIRGVSTARYTDYAGRSGVGVRDEQAFEEMRSYLLDRYGNTSVVASYASGGVVFDCVRLAGTAHPAPTPAPPPTGATARATATAQHACPAGTVPVRRVTLEQLVRFATLQSFLSKDGGGGGLPPIPSPTG